MDPQLGSGCRPACGVTCGVVFQAFLLEQTSDSLQAPCLPLLTSLLRQKSLSLVPGPLGLAQTYKKPTGAVILRAVPVSPLEWVSGSHGWGQSSELALKSKEQIEDGTDRG